MTEKIRNTKNRQKSAIGRKPNWLLFFYWPIFLLSIFLILFSTAASSLDPDLGWHLRIGQEIATEKQVPQTEKITYPTLGQKWVDHEWLSNLLLYSIDSIGANLGYWMMSTFFSLVLIATYWIIILTTKKLILKGTNKQESALFISVAILVSLYPLLIFFGNRLQVLSWFFLALLFFLLTKTFFGKKLFLAPIIPLIFFVWANLHGSFVFGLGVLTCFCTLFLLKRSGSKENFIIASILASSILASFLTPYGTDLWKLIVGEYASNRGYLSQITEWKPLFSKPNILIVPSLYIALFIAMSFVFFPAKKQLRKNPLSLYLLFVCFMLLLAIKSRRFVPLFSLASIPLMSSYFKNFLLDLKIKKQHLLVLLVAFISVSLFYYFNHKPYHKDPFSVQNFFSPHKAVEKIKKDNTLKELKIFNEYGWGGYLNWVWQEKQIFIDGRMPQKPLRNGNTFFEEYQSFQEEPEKKLAEHKIEIVLVRNNTPFAFRSKTKKFIYEKIFFTAENELRERDLLNEYLHNNWKKIYQDDESLIFIRSDASWPH